jgi:hypothetical protein
MNKELESKTIASDLCRLALLLNTYRLCSDVSPLDKAGQSFLVKESPTWGYELQKITFNNADEVGGRIPYDATQISISLTVSIASENNEADIVANPLTALAVDIEVDGCRLNPKTGDIDDLYSCWHLDMHTEKDGDGVPKYSHPMYHFAFGGNKMEGMGDGFFGNSVILPSPRFMYPPMDAVLAIDFILQNYYERDSLKELLDDPIYLEILSNSQNRLWKPFFTSLYSNWENLGHNIAPNFINKKLFPFYC